MGVWMLIPIRCNHATIHIQQGSHPSFPRKRESIRPLSVNTAASHRNGISISVDPWDNWAIGALAGEAGTLMGPVR